MHRNRSASAPVQRYWKAVPTGMSMETPGVRTVSSSPLSSRRQISPPAGQDMPELAHRGMDSRPVYLPWRDRGMDHVAGCGLHQVADLRPGGGAGIGGLGKRAGLHGHSFADSSTAYGTTRPPLSARLRRGSSSEGGTSPLPEALALFPGDVRREGRRNTTRTCPHRSPDRPRGEVMSGHRSSRLWWRRELPRLCASGGILTES